jgi:hypothetical protein
VTLAEETIGFKAEVPFDDGRATTTDRHRDNLF